MIHDKLVSGQFLLDLKNEQSSLLPSNGVLPQPHHPTLSSHILAHPPLNHLHHLPHPPQSTTYPPAPVPLANLELYSAYAYQQQLQQRLFNAAATLPLVPPSNTIIPPVLKTVTTPMEIQSSNPTSPIEVLDLSRRYDSIEILPKTPSPYNTNSSLENGSPNCSPANLPLLPSINCNTISIPTACKIPTLPQASIQQQLTTVSGGLVYPSPSYATVTSATNTINSSLYSSSVCYNKNGIISTAPLSSACKTLTTNHQQDTITKTDVLLPTTATTIPTIPTSVANVAVGAVNSGVSPLSVLESKVTRPFKAYPRDPLVIAANFAATDVLLDNPRVERYTEYRKRVLEQIRNTNGGSRTVTNPKMRRTNSGSGGVADETSSNHSENEERHHTDPESSDTDSTNSINILNNNSNNNNEDIKDIKFSEPLPAISNSNAMTTSTISTAFTTSSSSSSTSVSTGSPTLCSSASTSCDSLNTAQGQQQQLSSNSNGIIKDAAYYERRRKNNAAAKKSRDRRRIKEDEIAIRAAYLERQNIELLCQIDALKAQLAAFTSKIVA